jgi:hypothetical protein
MEHTTVSSPASVSEQVEATSSTAQVTQPVSEVSITETLADATLETVSLQETTETTVQQDDGQNVVVTTVTTTVTEVVQVEETVTVQGETTKVEEEIVVQEEIKEAEAKETTTVQEETKEAQETNTAQEETKEVEIQETTTVQEETKEDVVEEAETVREVTVQEETKETVERQVETSQKRSSVPAPVDTTEARRRTSTAPLSPTVSTSTLFLIKALKSFITSREAKRSKEFMDATQAALELLESENTSLRTQQEFYTVFTPLRLACETSNIPLTISAIDCIEKLISYKLIGSDAEDRRNRRRQRAVSRQQSTNTVRSKGNAVDDRATGTGSEEAGEDTSTIAPTTSEQATVGTEEQDVTQRNVIDDIITVVCDAFVGEHTDDKVTLQIIKVSLMDVKII